MVTNLFEPYRIGNLELPNRFIRSATWDGTADVIGTVTDASVALYRELGNGGIGLIVIGYTFVSLSGQAIDRQYGIYSDDLIPGLRRLTAAVHKYGGKIAIQLVHGGISVVADVGTALAVSPVDRVERPHREMTGEEIESIIDDFAVAAVRARSAGFDAVQLHGAHGYLMSQFLSPSFNTRTDKWGGSPKNRRRFHLEVIRRIRKAVGNDYPLFIKFGIKDEMEGGLTLEEGIETAKSMVAAGIDAIEVSAGANSRRVAIPLAKPGDPERVVFRERAAALKQAVDVPVILVGGIRNLPTAQEIVNSGDADMIAMCRPFIREPGIINRWRKDATSSGCISCNRCLSDLRKGYTLGCHQERQATGGTTDD